MKYITPEISWHSRDPLYSVDLQSGCWSLRRLATCGTDRVVRLWEIKLPKSCSAVKDKSVATVEFLSTLNRHSRTVNVVRFSPDGSVLASGADDAAVILWRLSDMPPSANLLQDDEEENRESWTAFKVFRSHLEDVYDISWSADSKLLLSGSVDNTAILWDVKKGHKLWMFTEHKGFVQGVAVDPLGQYLATLSDDRSLRLFSLTSRQLIHDVKRIQVAGSKSIRMFHSAETMKTFFRRLEFSPDGLLLIAPAGYWENAGVTSDAGPAVGINTSYVFCRSNLTRPVMSLVGPSKPTLIVRFCPLLFELRKIPREVSLKKQSDDLSEHTEDEQEWMKYETLFKLPYRMIFAVASEDSVQLYDTQQPMPFAHVANLHYHTLSDLTWSHDAQLLIISSTDGYCTLITFDENELGSVYKKCEVVAPVSVSSPVKPVHQVEECLSEVKIAGSKELGIVQTASVTKPVSTDCSPQRKKARRVVLQTLSTNVADFTKLPHEISDGKTPAAKSLVQEPVLTNSEKCRAVISNGDISSNVLSSGHVDDFSKITDNELANDSRAEGMDVCGEIQVAKKCDNAEMDTCQADLHLVLELSNDTTSSMMPPPSTITLPTSALQTVSSVGTCTSMNISSATAAAIDKQKPPRRVQLTTLK